MEKVKDAVDAMEYTKNEFLEEEKRRVDEEKRRLDDGLIIKIKVDLPEAPNPLLRANFKSDNKLFERQLGKLAVEEIKFTDRDATLKVPKGKSE
jgi:hypothetical protein